jgi:hypothetical protein
MKKGNGIYYFPYDERYEGEFENDKYNGKGTVYFQDGTKFTGVWEDGVAKGTEKELLQPKTEAEEMLTTNRDDIKSNEKNINEIALDKNSNQENTTASVMIEKKPILNAKELTDEFRIRYLNSTFIRRKSKISS